MDPVIFQACKGVKGHLASDQQFKKPASVRGAEVYNEQNLYIHKVEVINVFFINAEENINRAT